MAKILVSIVILTKNGEMYLDEVLKSVFAQNVNFGYEVLTVDSGSCDRTLEIINKYNTRLVRINASEFNHGATRNLGARLAKGEYVVYLSQDATPGNEKWLSELVGPFADKRVAGVYSRHSPREDCNPVLQKMMTKVWPTGLSRDLMVVPADLKRYEDNLSKIIHFSDSSSAIRRKVLLEIPFFDTMFAEDMQWEIEALGAGYKVFYNSKSVIRHSHDYSLVEQVRQNYDHERAVSHIFRGRRGKGGIVWRLFNPFRIVWIVWSDFKYIFFKYKCDLPSKLGWMAYSPLWHLAVFGGTFLGGISDLLPEIVRNNLSRQRRIKNR